MLRSSTRVFSYHRSVVPSHRRACWPACAPPPCWGSTPTWWKSRPTLLDADFPHERPKARVLAQGVEVGCRHVGREPFRALLVGRLQPAQRLLVVPQPHVDQCDGESRVAGRAALERREGLLPLGALARAPEAVPPEPRVRGWVARERRHLSRRRH